MTETEREDTEGRDQERAEGGSSRGRQLLRATARRDLLWALADSSPSSCACQGSDGPKQEAYFLTGPLNN